MLTFYSPMKFVCLFIGFLICLLVCSIILDRPISCSNAGRLDMIFMSDIESPNNKTYNQHFQQGLFTMACRIASGAQVSHFLQPEELFLTSSIKPIPEERTFLIKHQSNS